MPAPQTRRILASLAFGLVVALTLGHAYAHHERVFVQRQQNAGRGHPPVKLGFMGAAGGQVTGSMHVLQVGGKRMLVDAGAQQGEKPVEGKETREEISLREALKADAIVLTHAHLDHIGRLPVLSKAGFRGKIFATPATAELAAHLLRDAAKIEKMNAQKDTQRGKPRAPRFTNEDVNRVLSQMETRGFENSFQPIPGVNLRFMEAGHILGAASLDLDIGGFGKIVFSGDVGRTKSMLYNAPRTSQGNRAIVMESTYGDRVNPNGSVKADFTKALTDALSRGGKVIIPAFALGRTQEVLYMLNQLYREGKVKVPVYLDSPLGARVTGVYRNFLGTLNPEVRAFAAKNGGDAFKWPMLSEVFSPQQSAEIANQPGPAIIIAGSGMVTGGRVIGHIQNHIENPQNTILFVGYQGERTLGREISEAADKENATLNIFGQTKAVKAKIVRLTGFSGHADQEELSQWANKSAAKGGSKVYLVHGEPAAQEALGKRLTAEGQKTRAPAHADEIDPDLD
jgi:metallo-beta-lactamase family protein